MYSETLSPVDDPEALSQKTLPKIPSKIDIDRQNQENADKKNADKLLKDLDDNYKNARQETIKSINVDIKELLENVEKTLDTQPTINDPSDLTDETPDTPWHIQSLLTNLVSGNLDSIPTDTHKEVADRGKEEAAKQVQSLVDRLPSFLQSLAS